MKALINALIALKADEATNAQMTMIHEAFNADEDENIVIACGKAGLKFTALAKILKI